MSRRALVSAILLTLAGRARADAPPACPVTGPSYAYTAFGE
jgi:hypothetical protein